MVINGDIPGLENIYTKNELERSTIFSMGKSTISMVMFNSYVCFPEKKTMEHHHFRWVNPRTFDWAIYTMSRTVGQSLPGRVDSPVMVDSPMGKSGG